MIKLDTLSDYPIFCNQEVGYMHLHGGNKLGVCKPINLQYNFS